MSLWGVPVLVTTQCNAGDGFLIDTTKMGTYHRQVRDRG